MDIHDIGQCAVCFGEEADIELINCGDRLCRSCLEQYFEYSLKAFSYNIQPAVMECPLCKCPMDQDDWEPYIALGREQLEKWQQFVQKERNIVKPCSGCNGKVSYLISPNECELDALLDTIIFGDDDNNTAEKIKSRLGLGAGMSAYTLFCESNVQSMDTNVMRANQLLLSEICTLCPISFQKCQLKALERFKFVECDKCHTITCMSCGNTSGYHMDKQCHQLVLKEMGKKMAKYVRPCPRCSARLSKDADGCNEMECQVCGWTFCWECLEKWSRQCGVYTCTRRLFDDCDSGSSDHEEELTAIPKRKTRKSNDNSPNSNVAWEVYEKIKKNKN